MTRKRLAPVVGAALLLWACSSNGSKSEAPTGSLTFQSTGDTTTSIVIGADGSSTVVTSSATDVTGPGDSNAPPPAGAVTALDATGPPGSFAPGLLSSARSTSIGVEIRAQSGAEPRQATVDHVVSILRDASGKPVDAAETSPIAGGGHSWTAGELTAIADQSRALQQGGGRAVIHLLFVHGTLGGDNGILGAAIRGDTAAIFMDRVDAAATPLVGSAGIEVSVVTHETGHLLGLVDLYLHTGRQDPDHPGHSTDRNSVMYWAVESDLVADLLQGGPPREFDDADRADLTTIRNGG